MSFNVATLQDSLTAIARVIGEIPNPSDPSKPFFTKVFVTIDENAPTAYYSYPNAMLSVIDRQFDGENAALGSYSLALNCYTYDASTPQGTRQMTAAERVLMEAVNLIEDTIGSEENGSFMAGVWMTGHDAPSPQASKGSGTVWAVTVALTLLRG